MNILQKLSNNKYINALNETMIMIIPITIIGGFSCLLAQYYDYLIIPYYLTLGIISLYICMGYTYKLSLYYQIPTMEVVFISMIAFLLIMITPESFNNDILSFIETLGASNMFFALIISILCVEITQKCFHYHFVINISNKASKAIQSSFEILIPMILILFICLFSNILCIYITNNGISNLFQIILSPLLSLSESLPSMIILCLCSGLLDFFGLQGHKTIGTLITSICTTNLALNLAAYNAHEDMTHIFAGSYISMWTGWLISIALLISILFVGKSTHLKTLSKASIIPTMFNINETLVLGLPSILNIYIFIPSMICRIFNLIVSYVCSYYNIIGKIYLTVPWTIPTPIAIYLSTMDIYALFLWILLLICNIVIFIPFVRKYDQSLLKKESLQQ